MKVSARVCGSISAWYPPTCTSSVNFSEQENFSRLCSVSLGRVACGTYRTLDRLTSFAILGEKQFYGMILLHQAVENLELLNVLQSAHQHNMEVFFTCLRVPPSVLKSIHSEISRI